jgi:hypothetical protein
VAALVVVEDPSAVALVDVAGVTSASGKKVSGRFTTFAFSTKRTKWSAGSRLPQTTHPNILFVSFSNLTQPLIFTISF